GHLVGSAQVHAVDGTFKIGRGARSERLGIATQASIETAANGSGTHVGAQNVVAGSSVTGYAIERDSNGNFVANVAAAWSLVNKTGGVAGADLAPAGDNKSATFTGHLVGSAQVHAVDGTF